MTHFTMPSFNKDIQVTVSLDFIAQQLLSTLKEDNPHRELIAYTIIGNMNEAGTIGQLLGSLSGFHRELNIEVGKEYLIDSKHLRFYNAPRPGDYTVKVLEIDEFKKYDNIRVSYNYEEAGGSLRTSETWVSPELLRL